MLLTALALMVATPCPTNAACIEAEGIIVVAGDAQRAQTLMDRASVAKVLWEAQLGVTAHQVAIVEDGINYPDVADQLIEEGYRIQTWRSPAGYRADIAARLRPVFERLMVGASEEAINAEIERSIERNGMTSKDDILGHELGHIWFAEAFAWPEISQASGRSYGVAAAPDWLDEVAAVSLDTPERNDELWAQICAQPLGNLSAQFSQYFSMEHPLLALETASINAGSAPNPEIQSAAEAASTPHGTGSDIGVVFVPSSATDGADVLRPEFFYGMSRVFLDYVLFSTGDLTAITEISQHISEGRSFDQWLATQTIGLPQDTTSISADLTAFTLSRCGE